MVTTTAIPLIIHGKDVLLSNNDRKHPISSTSAPHLKSFQGATPDLAIQAVESCASAFPTWSQTPPEEPAGIVEETASVITAAMSGTIPSSQGNTYALVMKKPLGVVLGIAPWNAPVVLGLRSVIPVIAAGNVAIFKGSELSPQTHYFLAALFREAGFPPGVVNFVLHRPQDAAEIYECMIQHPAVKKCNFTGSTQVGRVIASKAAMALKPVLLELGGKNPVVVLEDADLDQAADEIMAAGYLNNGQICMSTDLVYVVRSVAEELTKKILERLHSEDRPHKVISTASRARLTQLVDDARSKGAVIHQARNPLAEDPQAFPATVIEGVTEEMEFYTIESFGPVFGIIAVDSAEKGLQMALGMSAEIAVGAVHVNGGTVHDEPTLPHGGVGDSGYGRFGGKWGLDEFLQTQTVILNRVRASL
ncbi:hypothetical protein AbraIFM66950_003689 [Aspergillus brasiliensis]|nr:hypothetical protein AbraIFM66950_003689 [Aspergillus brasiliensis]